MTRMNRRTFGLLALTVLAALPLFGQGSGSAQVRPYTTTWFVPSSATTNTLAMRSDGSIYSSSWSDINGTKHTVTTTQEPGEAFIDAARRHSMAVHAMQQLFPPAQQ